MSRETQVQEILKEVSDHHEINIEELTGSGRSAPLVLARKDAYRKLEQAGFGPCEVGRALNRDPSTVTRGLATRMCPKGHGQLRREGRYAVCTTCGHEEPLEELPTDDSGKGKYADKRSKVYGHNQGYRYPEDIKRQAVRDIERGIDKEEVCKRVCCQLSTLYQWIEKYGEKSKVAANLKSLKEMLTELRRSRFDLLRDASVLNSRIETIEEAIKILEEANEK